jgi:hypothetical protein
MTQYNFSEEEADALLDLVVYKIIELGIKAGVDAGTSPIPRDEFLRWIRLAGELCAPRPRIGTYMDGVYDIIEPAIETGAADIVPPAPVDPRAADPRCIHGVPSSQACEACTNRVILSDAEANGPPEAIAHTPECPVAQPGYVFVSSSQGQIDPCTCHYEARFVERVRQERLRQPR